MRRDPTGNAKAQLARPDARHDAPSRDGARHRRRARGLPHRAASAGRGRRSRGRRRRPGTGVGKLDSEPYRRPASPKPGASCSKNPIGRLNEALIPSERDQLDRHSPASSSQPCLGSCVGVLIAFGHEQKTAVREVYCPMAFDNRGAAWLQIEEVKANPYFGASMLRCGTLTRVDRSGLPGRPWLGLGGRFGRGFNGRPSTSMQQAARRRARQKILPRESTHSSPENRPLERFRRGRRQKVLTTIRRTRPRPVYRTLSRKIQQKVTKATKGRDCVSDDPETARSPRLPRLLTRSFRDALRIRTGGIGGIGEEGRTGRAGRARRARQSRKSRNELEAARRVGTARPSLRAFADRLTDSTRQARSSSLLTVELGPTRSILPLEARR